MDTTGALVLVRGVSKHFPGVVALDRVDFDLHASEIHALLGENGAGKSTLIKVIAGVYPPDAGAMWIRGAEVHLFTPHQARALGVGTAYQGFSLVPSLTVAQNLFLGSEVVSSQITGWLDRAAMLARAREVLGSVGLDVDPDTPIDRLGASSQQLVEIAKVLLLGAEIVILDEPTDKLTASETKRLFDLLRAMRHAGKGIVYITHKLEEVAEIADRVTVLRDGKRVATVDASTASVSQLIQMMVGRDLEEMFPELHSVPGAELLRVEDLSVPEALHQVNLVVHAGEIVGMAGLVGSGRSTLARALMGAVPNARGSITISGQPVSITSPEMAVRMGLALLPEDRHRDGLFLHLPVRENIVLPSLRRPWLDFRAMDKVARGFVTRLRIRTPSLKTRAMQLSGGNQQKVVLSKWLASQAKVYIFDEPTQGIDVASKVEIYRLISELAESGAAILLISSELREVLALSHRIVVMRKGRLVREFSRREATPERVLASVFGESAA